MSEFIYALEGAKYWKDLEATQEAEEGDLVARVTLGGSSCLSMVQKNPSLRPTFGRSRRLDD